MRFRHVIEWRWPSLIKPKPEPALEPDEPETQECHWCGADEEPCNCAMVYGDSDFLFDQQREADLERE